MVGTVVLDDVARARPGRGRRRAPGGWSSSPGRRRGWRPRPAAGRTAGARCVDGGVQAAAQVHRADQRLERVGEDRVLLAAAGGLLAAAQQQVRADAALAQPPGDPGQRGHVDHGGTQLGQLALGEVGLAAVELVGDDQPEHRVAQELQALVGRQAAVLVREGPVGQRQPEQPVRAARRRGRRAASAAAWSACACPPGATWVRHLPRRRRHDGAQRRRLRPRGPDGRRTGRSSGTPGAGA